MLEFKDYDYQKQFWWCNNYVKRTDEKFVASQDKLYTLGLSQAAYSALSVLGIDEELCECVSEAFENGCASLVELFEKNNAKVPEPLEDAEKYPCIGDWKK